MQLRHLELAKRHVAQGERLIAEQEERIASWHGSEWTRPRPKPF